MRSFGRDSSSGSLLLGEPVANSGNSGRGMGRASVGMGIASLEGPIFELVLVDGVEFHQCSLMSNYAGFQGRKRVRPWLPLSVSRSFDVRGGLLTIPQMFHGCSFVLLMERVSVSRSIQEKERTQSWNERTLALVALWGQQIDWSMAM